MKHELSFETNNARVITLTQYEHDGPVHYATNDRPDVDYIPAGDMVMLLNLYRYVKGNDIQNDFINPNGKYKEV